MTPVRLVAAREDASLAGIPLGAGDVPVVALGRAATDAVPAVRWLDRAPAEGDPPAERLVAPAGEDLWRVAPWPAADALFDLAPAAAGSVLLAGAESGVADAVAARAAERGVPLDRVERVDAERVAGACCVILAESPRGALPARAFAVLAAARLLIVPRLATTFGLEDGLDHVEFADPDAAIATVEAYLRDPAAFGRMLSWGRVKAQPQRASVVYARLADDLRLQGAALGG